VSLQGAGNKPWFSKTSCLRSSGILPQGLIKAGSEEKEIQLRDCPRRQDFSLRKLLGTAGGKIQTCMNGDLTKRAEGFYIRQEKESLPVAYLFF
jgi:hypothetical protein